jgi:RNA polymerase sigma factor (sigma-70 family)
MRRYNQRLYRAVRSVLRDEDEIEDVMQDAYVRAYKHLADFEGRSQFSTCLIRIAMHEAFARRRRDARLQQPDDDSPNGEIPKFGTDAHDAFVFMGDRCDRVVEGVLHLLAELPKLSIQSSTKR